jgi:hypothetical protein
MTSLLALEAWAITLSLLGFPGWQQLNEPMNNWGVLGMLNGFINLTFCTKWNRTVTG